MLFLLNWGYIIFLCAMAVVSEAGKLLSTNAACYKKCGDYSVIKKSDRTI